MEITLKELPKSEVEITVEVTVEEQEPYLKAAAEQISANKQIAGFRPGKAPYENVKQQFGDMTILEAALETIVKQTYFKAVKEKKLETIGAPKIDIEKSAPGNAIIYKATIALLPKITLPDWKATKISRKIKEITEDEICKVIDDVRKMQAKETLVARPAQKADKVLLDMDIQLGGVPVEGGQAKDHSVFLDEDHYIPGLADKLIGATQDQVLEFQLPFPENFYQKMLAGKNADFKINIKGVYERTLADLTDEFAKTLGQQSIEDLKKAVRENLKMEADQKEEQRVEIELLKTLTDASTFDEIPEIIITEEKQKMFAELKASLAERGLEFEDYLQNIKKTVEQLADDFTKGAMDRAKTALLIRAIAKEENIDITPEEFKAELEHVREIYKENKDVDERLAQPELQDYIAHMLLNRKVLFLLKHKILGDELKQVHNCSHEEHDHQHDHQS